MESSPVRSKIASFEAMRNTNNSSPTTSSAISGNHKHSMPLQGASPARASTSVRAAQNRVSRIRQEQMTKDGKSQQPIEKQIEKRKLLKERRIMQQRQQRHQSSTVEDNGSSVVSIEKPNILPRRTEYEAENKAEAREKPMQAESPSRGASRLSKMQRMQKMLGYDATKKGKKPRQSTAGLSSVSAATTEVVQNSFNSNQAQGRQQRQTSRARRNSRQQTPSTPGTQTSNWDRSNKAPVSPQARNPGYHSRSPASDIDAFGPTDQSIEPITDDEATLTSVRQIMTRDHNNNNNNKNNSNKHETDHHRQKERSFHYQHLDAYEDSTRGIRANKDSGMPHKNSKLDRRSTQWPREEKSDKGAYSRRLPAVSSSDYDTDGDGSKMSRSNNALDGPTNSYVSDVNEFFTESKYSQGNRRIDDDENTFDYGDRDEESNASTSFVVRHQRQMDGSKQTETASTMGTHEGRKQQGTASLVNKEDVEYYSKAMDSSAMKMGVGVAGAVTAGCLILGPAGLLAGLAVVGLGVGAMQIPEEERNRIQDRFQKTAHKVHNKALDASEKLSNSCATTYEDSGVAEHLPPCFTLPAHENVVKDDDSAVSQSKEGKKTKKVAPSASRGAQRMSKVSPKRQGPMPPGRAEVAEFPRNKKVACLRNVRIPPPGQIHGLDPSAQPKAWLDVVASANTSEDEKIEAMEEIILLAKDKRRAQVFLEEGILDSLIWTLDRYFEKVNGHDKQWQNANISVRERQAVKLAAGCCVTLGKAHCAAIHTEGDLHLMSMYERGTVPEERQVAQMLHEIPHHVRITKLDDPTIIDPKKEVFGLRQLGLQQAQELALSIKAVFDGKY